jgi:hypothetical protein
LSERRLGWRIRDRFNGCDDRRICRQAADRSRGHGRWFDDQRIAGLSVLAHRALAALPASGFLHTLDDRQGRGAAERHTGRCGAFGGFGGCEFWRDCGETRRYKPGTVVGAVLRRQIQHSCQITRDQGARYDLRNTADRKERQQQG